MEWQKLMEVVIGLTDGFVHASAVVVLTFCQCEMTRGKIDETIFRLKIEGTSGEKLWTVLLSGVLILLDCVCLSQIEATTENTF